MLVNCTLILKKEKKQPDSSKRDTENVPLDEDMDDDKLFDLYKKTFEMEKPQYFNIESGVMKAAQIADKKIPKESDENLNKLIFIFLLGYDIFSKKRLIEKLIDELDRKEE